MRTVLIAASAVAMLAAGGAGAQRVVMQGPGAGYAAPGAMRVGAPMPGNPAMVGQPHGTGFNPNYRPAPQPRWGSNVGGRWWAGANAPGGWRAYHRPSRGGTLPGYWIAPSFAIGDWGSYGLGEPPAGYGWSRYYDDAVLTDGRGRVYDCVSGVDWSRGDAGYAQADYGEGYAGQDGVYAGAGERGYAPPVAFAPPAPVVQPLPYAQPSPYQATAGYPAGDYAPEPRYRERRNSGVGGALVGAAAGGIAGNLIAGRGNRLAGTLIGAGVGGAAGYAIDRSHSHVAPVAQGAPYPAPGYVPAPGYAPGAGYAPPPMPTGTWNAGGGTTVTTSSSSGWGGTTTVVTVQTAPVITTTTTEIVEDSVTYSRHVKPARHKWVRRPACACR